MIANHTRPAVFLDRDGTLIEDPGYLRDPEQVRLLPGVAEALRRLKAQGFAVVVATNQSGVARGLMNEADVKAVHDRLSAELARQGAALDAIYYCPYLDGPEAVRPEYRRDSDLRKPRPGMLRLAAEEHGLDLSSSWMVGDSARDVEAGRAARCRTILFSQGREEPPTLSTPPDYAASSLAEAVDIIMANAEPETGGQQTPEATTHNGAGDFFAKEGKSSERSLLEQILEQVRMARREARRDDFSLARLGGAVAQAVALCFIGAGLFAWLDAGQRSDGATVATVRLLAGIALQLMALTFFAAAARRS